MDSVDFANNVNNGLVTRRRLARQSRVMDMMGCLHADIFFQDRYMIRSKDAFCLMEGADFKVQITYTSLFVRKVKLMSSVFLEHAKALECGTAKCPIRRQSCTRSHST